jgi:hypothetical protein
MSDRVGFRYRFEANAFVVDEDYLRETERMANLNEKEIEELAEKKFLAYLNDGMNPIKLEFKINGVERLRYYSVVSELNYGERGYSMSIPEEIKYSIVDDISDYVNDKFKHYKEDCQKLVNKLYNEKEKYYQRKVKLWKYLSCITLSLLLIDLICKMI